MDDNAAAVRPPRKIGASNPPIEARDAVLAVALTLLAPVAWIAPSRWWRSISRFAAGLIRAVLPWRTRVRIRPIRHVTTAQPGMPDADGIDSRVLAGRVEQELHYLAEFGGRRWTPTLSLAGRDYVDQALERGRGCILWVAPFLYGALMVKKALHHAGFSVVHLSHEFHGPSNSRFGRRFINVVKTRSEERLVAERLSMKRGTEMRDMRRLERHLRDNRVVSISCAHYGHRIVDIPLFGGRFPVGTGAPSLALASRAALLPVFTLSEAPDLFEIVVEPALEADDVGGRRAAVAELLRQYAALMESRVARHPASFSGWRYLTTNGS